MKTYDFFFRSLISAVELNDLTDSADDGDTDVNVGATAAIKSSIPAHLLDECSNDSTASRFSAASASEQLDPVANSLDPASLDRFLREADPDLATGDVSNCTSPVPADSDKKKPKRRSSDKRHHHHHKHHRRSNKDSTFPMDDPMDRLVACNVDEVLLDCLEDELPSVTLDGELPGSEPLELVESYNECDAMALCSSRKTRPRPFLRTPSTSSTSTLDTKEKHSDDLVRKATKNRLAAMSASPKRKLIDDDDDDDADARVADAKEEDSSSESTSAFDVMSVASADLVPKKKSPIKTKASSPGKPKVVPKMKLKVPPKGGAARKTVAAKSIKKSPAVKKLQGVAGSRKKPSPAARGRARLNVKIRRQKSKYVVDDFDEDDDVDDSDNDSHEVFQLTPSSSKNLKLKLIVRKKNVRATRGASKLVRTPIRLPIRRKKVEETDDDSSEESDDDDNDEDDVSDEDESVVSEDERVVVRPQRLKTKKPSPRKRRR